MEIHWHHWVASTNPNFTEECSVCGALRGWKRGQLRLPQREKAWFLDQLEQVRGSR